MTSPCRSIQAVSQIKTRSSVEIDVPAASAWAVIADFSRNPEWQRGMKACQWVTEPPLAVGSRYEQRASFLGREIRSLFEVVELEPGRRVSIDTIEGTFPITVTRSVEAAGDGCVVTAEVSGDAGGIFGILSPLMRPLVKRSVDGDYARLKRLLEI